MRDQELGAEYVDADKQAEKTFIDYVPPRLPNAQSRLPACLLACLQTLSASWGAEAVVLLVSRRGWAKAHRRMRPPRRGALLTPGWF